MTKKTSKESDVKIEHKRGTLVMTFTPAAYELYKQAIYKYYRDHPQLRCVKSYTVFLLIDAPGANAFLK